MYLEYLKNKTKEDLVNTLYNARIEQWADYRDGQTDPHGHGKRISYIGWFWRHPDFVNNLVSIGDCGSFIGVMENNKWGYPERLMTPEEVDAFISHLEAAFAELDKGGDLAKTHKRAEEKFAALWEWFQTLTI